MTKNRKRGMALFTVLVVAAVLLTFLSLGLRLGGDGVLFVSQTHRRNVALGAAEAGVHQAMIALETDKNFQGEGNGRLEESNSSFRFEVDNELLGEGKARVVSTGTCGSVSRTLEAILEVDTPSVPAASIAAKTYIYDYAYSNGISSAKSPLARPGFFHVEHNAGSSPSVLGQAFQQPAHSGMSSHHSGRSSFHSTGTISTSGHFSSALETVEPEKRESWSQRNPLRLDPDRMMQGSFPQTGFEGDVTVGPAQVIVGATLDGLHDDPESLGDGDPGDGDTGDGDPGDGGHGGGGNDANGDPSFDLPPDHPDYDPSLPYNGGSGPDNGGASTDLVANPRTWEYTDVQGQVVINENTRFSGHLVFNDPVVVPEGRKLVVDGSCDFLGGLSGEGEVVITGDGLIVTDNNFDPSYDEGIKLYIGECLFISNPNYEVINGEVTEHDFNEIGDYFARMPMEASTDISVNLPVSAPQDGDFFTWFHDSLARPDDSFRLWYNGDGTDINPGLSEDTKQWLRNSLPLLQEINDWAR